MRTLLFALIAALTLSPLAVAQSIEDRVRQLEARRASASTPPPAPLYGAYLGSLTVTEQPALGTFLRFLDTRFVFLSESEGTAELLRGGETVARFDWVTYDQAGPFYDIEPLRVTWPESDFSALGVPLDEPGDYEIVYRMGGEPFWRMPFTVTTSGGDDPYAPDPSVRLDGPWADHAYILHDTDESGSWVFKRWLHPDDVSTAMAPTVTVSRAGSTEPILVGGSPEHHLGISGDNWNRVEYELQWPGRRNATSGAYYDNPAFRANTERLDDGDYVLTYDLNPGPVSRYPFTVRNGAIVPTGRQALGADPMTRIDGGGAAAWLVEAR